MYHGISKLPNISLLCSPTNLVHCLVETKISLDFPSLEPQDQEKTNFGNCYSSLFKKIIFGIYLSYWWPPIWSVTVKFQHMASMIWECSNSLSPSSYYMVYKSIFSDIYWGLCGQLFPPGYLKELNNHWIIT